MMTLSPTSFWNDNVSIVYNENEYKKMRGSDDNTEKILYYDWPGVHIQGKIGGRKVRVMLAEKKFEKFES